MQPQLTGQPVRLLVLTPPGKVWKPGIPHPIKGSEDVLSSCQAVPGHCILCIIPPETAQKQLVHRAWERQELSPGSLWGSSLVCSSGGWTGAEIRAGMGAGGYRPLWDYSAAEWGFKAKFQKLSFRSGILKGIYIWRTFSFCGSSGFPQIAW